MKTIVTHDGNFHTDDVFGVAALALFIEGNGEEVKIIRSRSLEVIEKGDYVVDVGGINDSNQNRFDHHQEGGAGFHKNGVPYAGFGLVWKKFGEPLCKSNKIADMINKKLVSHIDAEDNGIKIITNNIDDVYPYTINEVVYALRPAWNEDDRNHYDAFLEAVNIAKTIIVREVKKTNAIYDAKEQSIKSLETPITDGIVVLPCYCPFEKFTKDYPDIYYVVYGDLSSTGNWSVKAVRDDTSDNEFALRKRFPKDWGGKRGKELEEITGIKGAVFCHINGFIAIGETKEVCIELAKKALAYDR